MGPDYRRPALDVDPDWQATTGSETAVIEAAWWRGFGDPQLDELVQRTLAHSPGLKAMIARLEQTRALARIAGADLAPSVQLKSERERKRLSRNEDLIAQLESADIALANTATMHTFALVVAYELDLWGRIRRAAEAAGAEWAATAEDARAARLVLIADVVRAYFDLRLADEQLELLARATEIERQRERLLGARHAAGLLADTERVAQAAEIERHALRAAELALQRAEAQHRLATLTGSNPGRLELAQAALRLRIEAPMVPVGLPAHVLEQRPDVRAAEHRLRAANAQIGQAQAARLPSVSLTGSIGYAARSLNDLWSDDSRAWSYGPRVHLPILSGGRDRARVSAAQAGYEHVSQNYRATVLRAIEEVEVALLALRDSEHRQAVAERMYQHQREIVARSNARLERGAVSRLEVLEAERKLIAADETRLSIYRARLDATLTLFKALGGGWQRTTPAAEP
jgi:NodT family efflux transporter outer membrane factor (OMF) lipoprotein